MCLGQRRAILEVQWGRTLFLSLVQVMKGSERRHTHVADYQWIKSMSIHILWRKRFVLLHVPNVYNVTWHDYATNINKEQLGKEITYVFKFRRGKRVATQSTPNVVKIEKATNMWYSWMLYHIMSWLFSIHNTHPSNLSIQSSNSPTTIIPDFKHSKNDQKSLCVNKGLTPLSSSSLYPTLYERKPWIG